ncbi:hypothetical protein V0288_00180 [Pannus brasiliensis CCIBt3594]|uniref:Uncharacterized protein n=1 Tax=Pannus brasiliensis CCIBt3594 TaxID=1427578 RepID=A0AAW9QEG6_9CHRO
MTERFSPEFGNKTYREKREKAGSSRSGILAGKPDRTAKTLPEPRYKVEFV